MRDDLAPLIERIAASVDAAGRWSLEAAEVRDLLGIDPLDFYRDLYSAATAERSVLDIGDICGTFSDEHPETLVAALEVFYGARAEQELAEAGIFVPHPSRVDIIEAFITAAAHAIACHLYSAADFSAMLRAFGSFEQARTAYITAHFPRDALIEEAQEAFLRGKRVMIPGLARANVRRLIDFFFRRHVLSEAELFSGISGRMHEQAVEEGYEPACERSGSAAPDPRAVDLESARQVLGVAGLPLSRRLLRERYRQLMKRYHPDVNPRGLEAAKEINAAYSRLLSAMS